MSGMLLLLFLLCSSVVTHASGRYKRDINDNKGNTAFFLQDPNDEMCLGPKGFTLCDESAVWILTKRPGVKTYSLVSLFNPNDNGLCLEVKSGWLGGKSVGMGSCSRKGAKKWEFDFVGSNSVKLHSTGYQLARGVPYRNSISMTPMGKAKRSPLEYHPTAVHEAGFYLKSGDGLCFDGEKFRGCTDTLSVLWGMGVKFEWGSAKRYIFSFKERNACIEAKGNKVYRGSCKGKHTLGWSLSHGRVQFDSGNSRSNSRSMCVTRRSDNTAAMSLCSEGFEYISMELPASYSAEDLQKMLKDKDNLSAKDRAVVESMLAQISGTSAKK